MNAILLASACFGALAAFIAADPNQLPQPTLIADGDRGAMTTTITVDPATGETTTTDFIAFLD
jgi:hypothetical protein